MVLLVTMLRTMSLIHWMVFKLDGISKSIKRLPFQPLINLLFNRFIGGKKEVAEFEQFRQVGPIVKVVPFSMGKGAVIAVLNDPNYQVCTHDLEDSNSRHK